VSFTFKILNCSGVFRKDNGVPARIKRRSKGPRPETEDTVMLKLVYLCLAWRIGSGEFGITKRSQEREREREKERQE
jgi:hypothetical protein